MEPAHGAPPASATPAVRHARRRFWLVVVVLLALIVLFEVGIRHVPPDGMTVTELGYASDSTYTVAYSYTAPQDQQTIGATNASLNTAPTVIGGIFAHYNCALTPPPYPTSIAFSWHGIPLETWYTGSCVVGDTAGGIPDFLWTGHYWQPDGSLLAPAPK